VLAPLGLRKILVSLKERLAQNSVPQQQDLVFRSGPDDSAHIHDPRRMYSPLLGSGSLQAPASLQ
jgi:hypothetical protein